MVIAFLLGLPVVIGDSTSAQLRAGDASGNCTSSYTHFLGDSWNQYTSCIAESNNIEEAFGRAATRLACQATWLARSQEAIWSYIRCAGFGF